MSYAKLPYWQYYINTSKDWRDTNKATFIPVYNHVEYTHKLFWLIPMKFSSEWECHYEEDRNVIQVNFEQTHGWKDWIANLLFPARLYDEFTYFDDDNVSHQVQLKACRGWIQMWSMMKHQVRDTVKHFLDMYPNAEVEVIGWSLGSSQAQYCAQDLNFNLHVKPYVFTYGSVKPWRGGKKVKHYLKTVYKECRNFMHRSDIVTYMPPFVGYFAMSPIKLGKFSLKGIFNPQKWHTEYGEEYLYKDL